MESAQGGPRKPTGYHRFPAKTSVCVMVGGLRSGESLNQRLSAEALEIEEDSKSVGFGRL
ncbi:hypothetical protein SDJN02_11025, partial [Cucurbita argyrosperma subsp. argyrosperma]